ncbi:hypothetical protein AS9A_0730 [Hoyosella subflava DQS3-9A1]|uniref:Uncharacterized protein n=1 Tax=Hoyosella subflava (strain DSM 45089 / JCM 17490 / NBRC 109087 / DQS3-9A1) TaxID=443218 RepID=F6EL92_HOYSD|nr:hypothetical protein AS9A_0730 [Hoyosella subflava DQS3-9A1]
MPGEDANDQFGAVADEPSAGEGQASFSPIEEKGDHGP